MKKEKEEKSNAMIPISSSYKISETVSNEEYDVEVSVILTIDFEDRRMSVKPLHHARNPFFQFEGTSLHSTASNLPQILLWRTIGKLITKATIEGGKLLKQYEEEYPDEMPF